MICPFFGFDSPVTVVQMLWINIIMDTLGGLAFAGEPPLDSYMKEPPKKRDEPILNSYMVNQILGLGGFTVALSLAFLKHPFFTSNFRSAEDNIYLLTAFFAFFIFAAVFNCFNARSDRVNLFAGITKNRPFALIMLMISVIQIGFVYLGGSVLRTTPLYWSELKTALLAALAVFRAGAVENVARKRNRVAVASAQQIRNAGSAAAACADRAAVCGQTPDARLLVHRHKVGYDKSA